MSSSPSFKLKELTPNEPAVFSILETKKMDPPDRIELLTWTVYYLEQGNLVQAKESLQKSYKYFQDLLPSELSKPTLQEIEIVNKAEKISIENVA